MFAETRNVSSVDENLALTIHPSRVTEWLPEFTPGVARSICDCRRLHARLDHIIRRHYDLSPFQPADPEDHAIARLPLDGLERIIRLAGAVWFGAAFKAQITRAALAKVGELVDDEAYRMTIAYQPSDRADSDARQAAELPTAEMIAELGMQCFQAWLHELPDGLRERVALTFAPGFACVTPPADVQAAGVAIVRHVAREAVGA